MSVKIPKNSIISVKKKEVYRTCYDDQLSVSIEVYEGKRMVASEKKFLWWQLLLL
jgi:molecular chaperone DnaK (HSP70)